MFSYFGCNSGQSQLEKEQQQEAYRDERERYVTTAETYFYEVVESMWRNSYGCAVDFNKVDTGLRRKNWTAVIQSLVPMDTARLDFYQKLSVAHCGGFLINGEPFKMVVSTPPDSVSKSSLGPWFHPEINTPTTPLVVISAQQWDDRREIIYQIYSGDFSFTYLKKMKNTEFTWKYHGIQWFVAFFYYSIVNRWGETITDILPWEQIPRETLFFKPATLAQAKKWYMRLVNDIADQLYPPVSLKSSTIVGL
ncbi:MAG: hypothetical protein WC659_04335 [Patescibacteria group bacterium]